MSVKKYDLDSILLARSILDKKFRDPILIADLARETGLSETKLKHGFKELFRTSVHNYQLQKRIEKARQLLTETDNPMKHIAIATGYRSISSFSLAFKK